MYEWVKKIHMYTGLFTFMAFAVWGATGIGALLLPPPGGYRPPDVSEVRELPFTAPSQLDDRQLAQAILPWARILAGVTTVLTLALWAATR